MARRFAALLLGVIAIAGCTCNQDGPAGGQGDANKVLPTMVDKLSITAPPGWKISGGKGVPETMEGPYVEGIQTSINLTALPFDGTLDQYEDVRLKDLQDRYIDFQLLARTEFTTKEGQKGIKSATEANLGGRTLRQNFYAFEAPDGKKHLFTCTVRATRGEEFDRLFDEIIGTYKP